MPPAIQVVRDRARADRAETVEFGDVFDFDSDGHEISRQLAVGSRQLEEVTELAVFSWQWAYGAKSLERGVERC